MTALIRLFFPNFDPAPTVENFGARLEKVERPGNYAEREKRLNEAFNRPA